MYQVITRIQDLNDKGEAYSIELVLVTGETLVGDVLAIDFGTVRLDIGDYKTRNRPLGNVAGREEHTLYVSWVHVVRARVIELG